MTRRGAPTTRSVKRAASTPGGASSDAQIVAVPTTAEPPAVPRGTIGLIDLGRVPYDVAWDLQRRLVDARASGEIDDVLILIEHPHTYTLGRHSPEEHVLLDADGLARVDAVLYRSDRGGDVTYHGPEQIVGYPILDLRTRGRDVHDYVRRLEQVLIDTIAEFGVVGGRIPGLSGVWVGDEKIAAIGVRVSRWITFHGFALNVNTDLTYFQHIIPCGIRDKGVTSLAKLIGHRVSLDLVRRHIAAHFAHQFGHEIVPLVAQHDASPLDVDAVLDLCTRAASGRGGLTP